MENLKYYFNLISLLTAHTWDTVLPLFRRQVLNKHDYFVEAHEVARTIGFLESGVVRAYFTNDEGKEYNKQFFVGHSLIGAYASLLTTKPNLCAQQALTDCVVYSCSYADLVALFDAHRDLERLARKVAEYYFIEKEQKEIEIVQLDAAQRYLIFQNQFPTLEQQISQYHIASYLGITPTQLSRIRHQFAVKKLVG